MMTRQAPQLGRTSAAFAMAAAVACGFNTALAWAKDASPSLNNFMTSFTGHHWITHGLADCIVFAGLGTVFMKTSVTSKIDANRLVSILVWAATASSLGLFVWYLFF